MRGERASYVMSSHDWLWATIQESPGKTADWYAGRCNYNSDWVRMTCWNLWQMGKLVLGMDAAGFVTFKVKE